MSQKCIIDCMELNQVKVDIKDLYVCVKKKVSWSTVYWFFGVVIPVFAIFILSFDAAKSGELKLLDLNQKAAAIRLERFETLQKAVIDNQITLRKELKEEKLRQEVFRIEREKQRREDVNLLLKAIQGSKK